jgi:hypothetical protein
MTEVTAAMLSACSGQRAAHWRWASAIGSKGWWSGTPQPYANGPPYATGIATVTACDDGLRDRGHDQPGLREAKISFNVKILNVNI